MAVAVKIWLAFMIFGLNQGTYNPEIAVSEIQEAIKKQASKDSLSKAQKHQERLKFIIDGKNKELLFEQVGKRLDNESGKFDAFKHDFKNEAQTVTDSIITHYSRIYESHGRVFDIDFGNNVSVEVVVAEWKNIAFDGVSISEYTEEYGHRYAFAEPNSIFLVGWKENAPCIKRYALEKIHDVKASEKGIEYVIFHSERKNVLQTVIEYHVFDDLNYYIVQKNGDQLMVFEPQEHGANKCPACFAGIGNLYDDDFIVQASPLSKSIEKLETLVKFDVFFTMYKYRSAFDTQIRPEPSPHKGKEQTGFVPAMEGATRESNAMLIKTMNKGNSGLESSDILGRVITLPYEFSMSKDKVDALINSIQNIPANVDILKYQDEFLDIQKSSIFDSAIGRGFGDAYRSQAINSEQVALNYDDQETNLNRFKGKVEKSINYLLVCSGQMVSESFVSVNWRLGNKHFLKSEKELYAELEQLYKATGNFAAIRQKQEEIFLTKNRHNPNAIQLYQLICVLQPFSGKPVSWIETNKDMLWQRQPDAMTLYANFDVVIGRFELQYGAIEQFGIAMQNQKARVDRILSEFNKIIDEYVNEQEATSGE